jgi:hypothetical protein
MTRRADGDRRNTLATAELAPAAGPAPRTTTLEQCLEEPFLTSGQVLLCSLGGDLAGEQTAQQLRGALLAAGFAAGVTRHLIRVSPLLRRSSKGRYQLRPLER